MKRKTGKDTWRTGRERTDGKQKCREEGMTAAGGRGRDPFPKGTGVGKVQTEYMFLKYALKILRKLPFHKKRKKIFF